MIETSDSGLACDGYGIANNINSCCWFVGMVRTFGLHGPHIVQLQGLKSAALPGVQVSKIETRQSDFHDEPLKAASTHFAHLSGKIVDRCYITASPVSHVGILEGPYSFEIDQVTRHVNNDSRLGTFCSHRVQVIRGTSADVNARKRMVNAPKLAVTNS